MHWPLAASTLLARSIGAASRIRHGSPLPVNSGRGACAFAPALRRGLAAAAAAAALVGCGEPAVPDHLRIAGARPERGQALIQAYGCGTCHRIDGVRGARGTVGPPLDRFAQRSLVAGTLPNTPRVLVAWLIDPPAIEPRTAMPAMGLDENEARDIAAYLYTLGAGGAQVYPPDPPLDLSRSEGPPLHTLRTSIAPGGSDPAE
jgi:mono/diheme cytochrome c family protein